MKTSSLLKPYLLLAGMALAGSGCRNDEAAPPLRNLDGAPAGAVNGARVLGVNGPSLSFELDLYVVDAKGNPVPGLKAKDFAVKDQPALSFITEDASPARMAATGDYSAMLLLDQSGSILSNDPRDLRIEAGKIFLNSLGSGDQAALSSFTSYYDSDVVIHAPFARDTKRHLAALDTLEKTEGGGTPLYMSAYQMIDYTARQAPGANKAVIVFTDGEDTRGGYTLEQVTAYAVSRQVRLYTVGLSNGVDEGVLADMAGQTNGAFMWADDAKQLITMFGTLGDLLEGTAALYKVRCAARTSSTWSSGDAFTAYLQVTLPAGGNLRVPFKITVQ
ncbi:MAG TPA: VWA domain-containing protein [Cytophagales bacterium]|jgi:hypothetical protein